MWLCIPEPPQVDWPHFWLQAEWWWGFGGPQCVPPLLLRGCCGCWWYTRPHEENGCHFFHSQLWTGAQAGEVLQSIVSVVGVVTGGVNVCMHFITKFSRYTVCVIHSYNFIMNVFCLFVFLLLFFLNLFNFMYKKNSTAVWRWGSE